MVNWDSITLPTDHGGLSIHVACPRNLSFLAKLDWKISVGDNSPWVKF